MTVTANLTLLLPALEVTKKRLLSDSRSCRPPTEQWQGVQTSVYCGCPPFNSTLPPRGLKVVLPSPWQTCHPDRGASRLQGFSCFPLPWEKHTRGLHKQRLGNVFASKHAEIFSFPHIFVTTDQLVCLFKGPCLSEFKFSSVFTTKDD